MLAHSPLALRLLKSGAHAGIDGLAGVQQLAGDATLLYYMTEEAQEGRDAYVEKRRAGLLEVPEAAVNVWLAGARPRTLGAGLVPVARGRRRGRHVHRLAVRRRAPRRARAPGRRELRERLLRRHPGRRHARAGRPAAARRDRRRLTAWPSSSRPCVSIGVAGFAGLALALVTEPVLILFVGALALVAAFAYSGGPRPYAGLGLGEVMVFLFFGLMATCGTAFVMDERVPAAAWWCGAVLGLLAVAILVANNLRDIPTDAADREADARGPSGRPANAAAVPCLRRGRVRHDRRSARWSTRRWPSAGLTPWALLGLVAWIPAIRPMELVGSASGRDLIRVLTGTAAVHAACGLLMAVGADPRAHRRPDRHPDRHVNPATSRSRVRRRSSTGLVDGGVAHACALAGVPFDAPRARPRARSPRAGARPARRAVERILRARRGEGDRTPGDRGVHERHGGRRAPARRRGSVSVTGAAVVLTADRPPRLRGTGANQTIVQPGPLRGVRPRLLSTCRCPRRRGRRHGGARRRTRRSRRWPPTRSVPCT